MASTKKRLDLILLEKGLFNSREKARAAIMAGNVMINGQRFDKPGHMIDPLADIKITETMPYVSRGGLKLAKAIQSFGLDLKNKVVMDIGASTGGFTDCALQQGARLVYAVDVGYGQLAWSLRNDPRVISLERTNIRYLSPEVLTEPVNFATIDVSFISLTKVLPRVRELTLPDACGVSLIKPQFEAGREKVGKKGVVRDPAVHKEVILAVCNVVMEMGWGVRGLDFSPVKGPEGNIEYLLHFCKASDTCIDVPSETVLVVERAHESL